MNNSAFTEYRLASDSHGEAPPRPDHVPEAAWHRHWAAVREVRRQMCHLRLLCTAVHAGPCLRRVQLWVVPGAVRHLRRCGHLRRLLLQGVHTAGEGQGRLPQDSQPR